MVYRHLGVRDGLVIDDIPALAWSARPDGSAEFLNQHYLAYVGLPLEQLQGSGWTAAVHPDDRSALAATWHSMRSAGAAGEAEARLGRFDGEYRWFLFGASPIRDESGTIVQWLGINTDIEDRKRAQEALAASERNLRSIVDTIRWPGRPARRLLRFPQPALARLLGHDHRAGAGMGVGRPIHEFLAVHPDAAGGGWADNNGRPGCVDPTFVCEALRSRSAGNASGYAGKGECTSRA